jgi:DNA polymerase-3 subunit delta
MPAPVRALDLLEGEEPPDLGTAAVVVLHGGETFVVLEMLARLRDVLCPDEADRAWAWREFAGDQDLDPRDVFDEAATVPLFAGATRAAVVRDADAFVTAARSRLEAVAAEPRGRRGLVILEVRSFPGTTRLAKVIATHGLAIETSIPPKYDLARWIRRWATARHGITLAAATSQRLLDRLGPQLGQIDQALARLAAATPAANRRTPLPPEAIDTFAGSPQDRAAWGMIDAAGGGDAAAAIGRLAELVAAEEHPIAIAAQASSVLRRLAAAARLLALPAGSGRPAGVDAALREAGVAAWPQAMQQARAALAQLGPGRARRIPGWLLELDLALKSDASRGLRAQLALERLFCKMARETSAGGGSPTRARPARPR